VAYLAHATCRSSNPRPHANQRGLPVLYVNSLQIVARADGGIRRIQDLRGTRVGVGAARYYREMELSR